MEQTVRENTKRHRKSLIGMLEPRFELLGMLYARDVLHDDEFEILNNLVTTHDRNSLIVDIVVNRCGAGCEKFMESLAESEQSHVASYIRHDGSQ